ncbi:uncharacterized protein LOC110180535 [Drosophila serrata]|uniref:uncharacterized protein LOC110180535 n=1 Tax=Drosophila serrata TaxID=7274 RepID=UPI000A1D2166|nr:uncharacterized protein LOC110180535 [Drosophila serrata]
MIASNDNQSMDFTVIMDDSGTKGIPGILKKCGSSKKTNVKKVRFMEENSVISFDKDACTASVGRNVKPIADIKDAGSAKDNPGNPKKFGVTQRGKYVKKVKPTEEDKALELQKDAKGARSARNVKNVAEPKNARGAKQKPGIKNKVEKVKSPDNKARDAKNVKNVAKEGEVLKDDDYAEYFKDVNFDEEVSDSQNTEDSGNFDEAENPDDPFGLKASLAMGLFASDASDNSDDSSHSDTSESSQPSKACKRIRAQNKKSTKSDSSSNVKNKDLPDLIDKHLKLTSKKEAVEAKSNRKPPASPKSSKSSIKSSPEKCPRKRKVKTIKMAEAILIPQRLRYPKQFLLHLKKKLCATFLLLFFREKKLHAIQN